jgi:hypothetical protein
MTPPIAAPCIAQLHSNSPFVSRTSSLALRSLFLRASARLSDRDEIISKSSASMCGHRIGLELRKSPSHNDF